MFSPTRRKVLKALLFGGTAIAAPSALYAAEYGRGEGMPWSPFRGQPPYHGTLEASFFTPAERATVAAICARLIPNDDGPGATEADVVTFLDRQMAGFYGRGQHWYMQGPFLEGTATQGYQSEHPPAQLYRHALVALDVYCRNTYEAGFAELSEDRQDAVLKGLDEEEITFAKVSAKTFFDLILKNTIEGFFADPIYGGNRDMVAWRYIGFPGTRYDYRDFVGHDGARIQLEPVSLMGRSGWNSP
ncbi:gluconate 2-dehydrogenase, membrane-bound, gamma subunit [Limimaricola cinnabarinus LL-001]|uniref:Gluconate 2-dehydrogenase, membrane-bound, gamma subunit n=1 Tax=Limimaricola cinnabarinus LL-001 TaxID=1337093 RepID=U3ART4_9RHOB|nr:gluconate 2-dehydrogenase, membrane-bound, gamma subunit [Limimaricola cinnabarinus LL-001]